MNTLQYIRQHVLLFMLVAISFPRCSAAEDTWTNILVPGAWEDNLPSIAAEYDGIAWYRSAVTIPTDWKSQSLLLYVEKTDNASETYFNGVKIGVSGNFPPDYINGLADHQHRYVIPAEAVRFDLPNTIAIRIYDSEGRGGFKGSAPILIAGDQAITMKGQWQFILGDNPSYANADTADLAGLPNYDQVSLAPKFSPMATTIRRVAQVDPLSPERSLQLFQTPPDLAVDLVLSEPDITQPVFINFDSKGRLWVMEYIQYPEPAGLEILSKDQFWRAVYDRVPEPPPVGPKGRDRISIHEDSDQDGKYDSHKIFVDGLNIATAFAQGRGGVWVLNPPYLLFYPDADQDDIPDSDPIVHLSGFGLEDTHSVVNSLRFGVDGWLYAAQGSTVSGNVRVQGEDTVASSQGQNIWRYHPETRRYEIFAEGGGNAFGVEIDSKGRIFSGHNGGNTRGFHYMQGAYLQKGFGKHGPLSNPYAFGYFPAMAHHNAPRFTHTFVINESDQLPSRYHGHLFGVSPLLYHVVISDVIATGSTFQTKDVSNAIESADHWFRPVDIKDGPDGNLYIADWYDGQLAHTANYQGGLDRDRGRIFRMRSVNTTNNTRQSIQFDSLPLKLSPDGQQQFVSAIPNMSTLSNRDLIAFVQHPNRWQRHAAINLLYDRRVDSQDIAILKAGLLDRSPDATVDWLWALHAAHQLDIATSIALLNHPNFSIRNWTIRLIGDRQQIDADEARFFQAASKIALQESNVEVLSQLAATAKRIPLGLSLPILLGMVSNDHCQDDPRVPLQIWWGLEKNIAVDRDATLTAVLESKLLEKPIMLNTILPRLMRRLASSGKVDDLEACGVLFEASPTDEVRSSLMEGFEEAYRGRSLATVPSKLVAELTKSGGGSLVLQVRQGNRSAISKAIETVENQTAEPEKRVELAEVLSQIKEPLLPPILLHVITRSSDEGMQSDLIHFLQEFENPDIADQLTTVYPTLTDPVRSCVLAVLASRPQWTVKLVDAILAGKIPATAVSVDIVRKMKLHPLPEIQKWISENWKELDSDATADQQRLFDKALLAVSAEGGDPYSGKRLYTEHCGKCHKLHEQGGDIGPDLTSFKRNDSRSLLYSIVFPSAEIREGYETYQALMQDGRITVGFMVQQDTLSTILKGADGRTTRLPVEELDQIAKSPRSIMPDGILQDLSDQQIRDLFAYLRTSQPLND